MRKVTTTPISLRGHTPLATSSNPKSISCSTTPMSAQYRKITEIYLHDWWLIKDEKALAVGGYAPTGESGQRRFSSAAIAKRHSINLLETIDGFTITVTGLINRFQTLENGYSSEVCNRFQIGFPYNWKDYAGGEDEQPSTLSAPSGICLDHLPVTKTCDLLMATLQDYGDCEMTKIIIKDIMDKVGFKYDGESTHSEVEDDTMTNHKKAKVLKKFNDKNGGDSDVLLPSKGGVATRRMTRSTNLRSNQEEKHSSSDSGVTENGDDKSAFRRSSARLKSSIK